MHFFFKVNHTLNFQTSRRYSQKNIHAEFKHFQISSWFEEVFLDNYLEVLLVISIDYGNQSPANHLKWNFCWKWVTAERRSIFPKSSILNVWLAWIYLWKLTLILMHFWFSRYLGLNMCYRLWLNICSIFHKRLYVKSYQIYGYKAIIM